MSRRSDPVVTDWSSPRAAIWEMPKPVIAWNVTFIASAGRLDAGGARRQVEIIEPPAHEFRWKAGHPDVSFILRLAFEARQEFELAQYPNVTLANGGGYRYSWS